MSRSHEVCKTLQSLGYRSGQKVRLYGEELQITSDPFLDGEQGLLARSPVPPYHAQPRAEKFPGTETQRAGK